MLLVLAAVVVAHVAALAFFPALVCAAHLAPWLGSSVRLAWPCHRAWCHCGTPGSRFLSMLVAIGLLPKLYDLFRSGDHPFRRGFLFSI